MTENVFPLTLALSLQGRGGRIDSRLRGCVINNYL